MNAQITPQITWLNGHPNRRFVDHPMLTPFVTEAESRGIRFDPAACPVGRPHVTAALIAAASQRDGRIRPRYAVNESTHRLTTRNPNLATLSRHSAALIPDDGHVFTVINPVHIEALAYASIAKDAALSAYFGTEDPFQTIASSLGIERNEAKIFVLTATTGRKFHASHFAERRLEVITQRFAAAFPRAWELTKGGVTTGRRVLRLASLAVAEGTAAAHAAAGEHDDTFAVAHLITTPVFTGPEDDADELGAELGHVFASAVRKRIRPYPAQVEVHTATSLDLSQL